MRFFDAPTDDAQRQQLEPKSIMSGILPGATQIRIGGSSSVLIDGLNQRITITNGTSSVGIGAIPGDEGNLGFYSADANGMVIQKIVGGTRYIYRPSNGENFLQDGILPDGSGGFIITKEGTPVPDVFS